MKFDIRKRCRLLLAIFFIIGVLAMPPGYGQGRGHAYGRDKKAYKFINGHDARDGRWDGRGPRPRIGRIYGYNRYYYRDRKWRKHKGKRMYSTFGYRRY